MLIIDMFLWILIWQSLSHFNCVLFCEVYVTEWENNSFYCLSYELIYKLKLKIFTRVINEQNFHYIFLQNIEQGFEMQLSGFLKAINRSNIK